MISKNKPVVIALIIAFVAKLMLAVWGSTNAAIDLGDQSTFRYWTSLLTGNGWENFYSKAKYFPYPPLANYLFFLLGKLCLILHVPLQSSLFNFFLRLPVILADLGTAILLFLLAKRFLIFRQAYWVLLLYLFSPAVIFISSVWGQQDGLMTFFLLLALYLFTGKKISLGMVMLLLAFLLKPQALPLIIPLYFLAWSRGGIKKIFLGTMLALILFFAMFYPFYPNDPFLGPLGYFSQILKDFSPRFTSSAFNFWYLLYGGWKDNFPLLFGVSAKIWSQALVIVAAFSFSLLAYLKKDLRDKILAVALSGLAFFLFFTQVKERYLFASLPFLLLFSFLSKNRVAIILAIVTPILFALNSLGFFIGWVWFGFWQSTFLSWGSLDKLIAAGFMLIFCYYLYLIAGFKKIQRPGKGKK